MEEKKPLWKKIALLMEKQGIKTVVKLADLSDVPATTIYTWKQDYELCNANKDRRPTTPNVYNLQKVAKALGVDINYLL